MQTIMVFGAVADDAQTTDSQPHDDAVAEMKKLIRTLSWR